MIPLPVDELVKISIAVCMAFLRLAIGLIVGLIQVLFGLISGGISLFVTQQQVKQARAIQAGPLEILEIVSDPGEGAGQLDATAMPGIILGESVYKE